MCFVQGRVYRVASCSLPSLQLDATVTARAARRRAAKSLRNRNKRDKREGRGRDVLGEFALGRVRKQRNDDCVDD